MDLAALAQIDPSMLRSLLPSWLAEFIDDPEERAASTERLGGLISDWPDERCQSVIAFMAELGDEHRVYPAHPACRGLTRSWCEAVLLEPTVQGAEYVMEALARGPTMLLGNHLSYFDANATDAILAFTGQELLADRLVAAAGPKVYQDAFRRFAAGCINTLPVVQSTTLRHTAKLAPRELARKAKASLEAARQALAAGSLVLVYPEGSRSRDGQLQAFIRGVHRWLSAVPNLQVVPTALEGTDQIMPVSARTLRPGRASLTFGAPLQVGPDTTSREVLAASHHALRDLLPPRLRPGRRHTGYRMRQGSVMRVQCTCATMRRR